MSVYGLQLLRDKARDFGIELSLHHLNLFGIYLTELMDWNRRINLTGLKSVDRIVIELLLDSLIPAPFLPDKGRMLDVGSGAGLPWIPLKIHSPQLSIHLLEANSKKVNFLKQVIRLLSLRDIHAIKGRIEKDEDNLHSDGYHLITARALAGLHQTIEWCSPFLLPGGLLVSFLGNRAEEDLKGCQQVMEDNCICFHRQIPYILPGKRSERNTVIFKKKI
ncbi:MAG: 16S rRNA (guanine(527)-N(7))-methyltransferase RsmG [Deltaproteobacteria bacterium]|nr:16S rRNA (guanine(527)-N(7))-methyltransferase RsmG [Deltaproteobacteria bacterium]